MEWRKGVIALIFLGVCGTAVCAQPAAKKALPYPGRVYDRAEVITEGPSKKMIAGSFLQFTLRPGSPGQKDALAARLHIRIFPLSAGRNRPDPFASPDDCEIFVGYVYSNRRADSNGETISLTQIPSSWLEATVGRPLEAARYLVMFESGEVPGEFVRLNRANVENHFGKGIIVIVLPPTPSPLTQGEINKLAGAHAEGSRITANALAKQAAKLPCYSVAALNADVVASEDQSCELLADQ